MAGNLSGLVGDPQFQQLSPAEQRQSLSRVTGDQSFSALSDDDLSHFVSKMNAPSSATVPSIIANAAKPAGAPSSVQMDTNTLGNVYSAGHTLKEADVDPVVQAGEGFGKSLLHTAAETGALVTDPIVRRIAPQAAQQSDANIANLTTPTNTAQKIGSVAGDIAPYLVPGVGEEKAATLLPKTPLLAKSLYGAVTTGAISAGESGNAKDAISGGAIGMLSPFLGKYVGEPLTKYLSEKAPANVINRLIGVSKKELQYSNNPGLAIANEGITASSIESLQNKVEQRIGALKGQLETAVRSAGVPSLDTSNAVISPIDREIANAMQGPVANKAYLNALVDLRDSVTHELTSEGARGNPKNLTMAPSDVLDFKRAIGKITRWTPENSAVYGELNSLKREIYHNLDTMLDHVAPGTEGLNSRMSNLISASEAIDRRIPVSARSAGFLTRIGAPLVGAAAAGVANGRPVEGAIAGVGLNAAKDAVLSTPGATARAQALQTAAPAVQPARRTLGALAADVVNKRFPNFFQNKKGASK